MKHKSLLFFLLFLYSSVVGQGIENNMNIYFTCSQVRNIGEGLLIKDGFQVPGLYSNMKSNHSWNIKLLKRFKSNFYYGIALGMDHYGDWTSQGSDLYQNSSVNSFFIEPLLQYKSLPGNSKIMRHFCFKIELGPCAGFNKIHLDQPVYTIYHDSALSEPPLHFNNFIFGYYASGGADYRISRKLGAFLSVGWQQVFFNSIYFIDNKYQNIRIEGGIFFKLSPDKYFYNWY